MKKSALFITLCCFSATLCFSQKTKSPLPPTAKPKTSKPATILKTAAAPPIEEISAAEWSGLTDALQTENWGKSAFLANEFLTKVKIENNKKQIARLRYFLLYALAGEIVEASTDGKNLEEDKARTELKKAANGFTGKKFFMPSRQLSADCEGKLNYICRSKEQSNVLRVTATNKSGTAIFSFEYVRLKENFNFLKDVGKQAILSGILNKVEFNPLKSNVWIMRLFFENGAINIVPEQ